MKKGAREKEKKVKRLFKAIKKNEKKKGKEKSKEKMKENLQWKNYFAKASVLFEFHQWPPKLLFIIIGNNDQLLIRQ